MLALGCTAAAAARPILRATTANMTSRTGPAAVIGAALAAPLRSVRAYAASSDDASDDASLAPGGGAAFWDKMDALAGDHKKSTETAVFAMG
jgi:hypothetical protein